MGKIMLLDGHSLIHRAFYGMPDFTNAEGTHTGAVYGFLSILFMLLSQEQPDGLMVAFDVHAPTFRHEMFKEYKGTRKPMLPELREQVPLTKELLNAMGIKTVEKEGFEADDVLGSLAALFGGNGQEVLIVSGDRDLLQLADEHTTICIPKTRKGTTVYEIYHPQEVKDLYHVTPIEFIDVKALMGDASDNIPGVPGIGEKTATNLIEQYGSIEEAYAHIDEVKPPRARNMLAEHYDMAQMSKVLATIKKDVDLGNADDLYQEALLAASPSGDPSDALFTPEAKSIFIKLNFKKYLNRFDKIQETSTESALQTEAPLLIKNVTDIESADQAEAFISSLDPDSVLGIALVRNTENEPLFALMHQAVYSVVLVQEKQAASLRISDKLSLETVGSFIDRCTQKGLVVSAIRLKDLMKELPLEQSEQFFDPSIAAYLINPLLNSYDAEDMAPFLGDEIPAPGMFFSEDHAESVTVSAAYALAAARLAPVLEEKLKETGMYDLMHQIEMPLVFTLDRMEKTGVLLAQDELREYGAMLKGRINEIQESIYEQAGMTFNINSPKQLGEVLFDKMGMPHGKKTKTGYSTSAKVLENLAEDYPFVRSILEYRQLTKLSSTYAEGLTRFVSDDGRIHGTFNQTVTATGRISSTDPNLQNIPIRVELGRMIRKAFVPREGCVFIDADYSQVELRILAHLSGDKKLIEAYKNAQDIHRTTASQVFHIPFDDVTETQRRNAKAVNFGIVYGISSFGLSQGLSITRAEAQNYIEHYFETFPGIKKFLDETVAFAKSNGYVTTMFGRRRPIPELTAANYMQRQFGERVAMNSPIQGTAADIMKIAMIRVEKALSDAGLKAKIVLQVHDELLVEAPESEIEAAEKIIREQMEGAADLSVDLKCAVGVGSNWYEAH